MHEEDWLLHPLKGAEPEFCLSTNLSYTLYHPPWLLLLCHQHKFRVALIRHRFSQLCYSYKPLMKVFSGYISTPPAGILPFCNVQVIKNWEVCGYTEYCSVVLK